MKKKNKLWTEKNKMFKDEDKKKKKYVRTR